MEPRFQSSFIPKNPTATSASSVAMGRGIKEKNHLLYLISLFVFWLSIFFALALFGYKFYLKNRISTMGSDLNQALTRIQPEPSVA